MVTQSHSSVLPFSHSDCSTFYNFRQKLQNVQELGIVITVTRVRIPPKSHCKRGKGRTFATLNIFNMHFKTLPEICSSLLVNRLVFQLLYRSVAQGGSWGLICICGSPPTFYQHPRRPGR